jgi:hypothetical protein
MNSSVTFKRPGRRLNNSGIYWKTVLRRRILGRKYNLSRKSFNSIKS